MGGSIKTDFVLEIMLRIFEHQINRLSGQGNNKGRFYRSLGSVALI